MKYIKNREQIRMNVFKKILGKYKKILFLVPPLIYYLSIFFHKDDNFERFHLANNETYVFLHSMKKKYKARCSAQGGGYREGKIDHVSIDLEVERDFEINDARQLIRAMVEEFVEINNRNREVMIYFKNQKCTHKNIDLGLSFSNKRDRDSYAYVTCIGRWITYRINDKNTDKYIHILKEEYDPLEMKSSNLESSL
jgi:hypothetical protein